MSIKLVQRSPIKKNVQTKPLEVIRLAALELITSRAIAVHTRSIGNKI